MKDTFNKFFKILGGLIGITLSFLIIGVAIATIIGVGAIMIAAIVPMVIIFVGGKGIHLLKKSIELHTLKNKLLHKYQENIEAQKEYAIERANSIQIIKDTNNEFVCAEEFVPINHEQLNNLKSTIHKMNSDNIATIMVYETIQKKVLEETNEERHAHIKQELTRLSFELQDIVTNHNLFLKDLKNSKEIYKAKDSFQKIKINNYKKHLNL